MASSAIGEPCDRWMSTNLRLSEPLSAIGPRTMASGHAGDLADGVGPIEIYEPGIAIGMHPAAEAGEVILRVLAFAVTREPMVRH